MKKSLIILVSLAIVCQTGAVESRGKKNRDKTIVNIDFNAVISEKNDWYFGGNNIYPRGGQGLMNSFGEFDKKTIEIAETIGLRTYRFPGGSEGNLYKWKRAIGPVDQRIDNVSGNNKGPQSNEFGPDEFGRLLETTGFKNGIIMVAYGYESLEDAADWVEYMNSPVGANPNGGVDWAAVRAKNGHPEPYGITSWEIGNEVYGNWELNWGSYPKQGDASRGSGNVPEDQRRGKAATLPFGNAERYVFGGYKYFQQQQAAVKSSWQENDVKTTGRPEQQFFAKFPPVDLSQADQPFVVTIGGNQWQRVDSLSTSSATDKHYTLDIRSGEIRFGDGFKGAIPRAGQFVMLDYRSGRQPGFIDYYKAMKVVDPNINVISCFEKESFYKHMAAAKQPFDGVVKHYYPRRIIEAAPASRKYAASIITGLNISLGIERHIKWFDAYDNPSLKGNEKLWITEYAIPNHIVQAAAMHTVINEHSESVAALLGHSLFLDNNTPMITDEGIVRSRALPIFLFSKLSEDNFVNVEVKAGNQSYQQQTFPKLLVTASTNQSKDRASVILTNTNDSKAIDVQVSLEGMVNSEQLTVTKWILSSNVKNKLADNTAKNPDNVSIKPDGKQILEDRIIDFTVPEGSIFTLVIETKNL